MDVLLLVEFILVSSNVMKVLNTLLCDPFLSSALADMCRQCAKQVPQPCSCGKETRNQPCGQPQWSCRTPCNKQLPCQRHKCQKVDFINIGNFKVVNWCYRFVIQAFVAIAPEVVKDFVPVGKRVKMCAM